ncbi:hypothetical protein TNCT_158151 [Trichonephila clavata]|uniref:Uncharacterized protein n=1 Tax=Trichonephila clavata TaxID=2740835 RepID=A0A8X6LGT9_TRICU|nr:hypothetical protein TNCT_158151 [Trichonephila clavata]
MNQHFNTNQLPMAPGYTQREFYNNEMNQQCETNQLSMSKEYSEMELCKHRMNPQVDANPQDVTDSHNYNSFVERNSSPKHRRVNKTDLNVGEHSIQSRKNSCSFGRSNIIYGEPKHEEYFEESGVIFSPTLLQTNSTSTIKVLHLIQHLRTPMLIQRKHQKKVNVAVFC